MMNPTKVCRVCKEELPIRAFHPNKSCALGVIGTCRECSKIRLNSWYKDNRTKRQDTQNKYNRDRKILWIEKKGGCCQHCGGLFPPCVFDFHHIEGKDVNPSKALSLSLERAEKEMSKCILLCSNCHRIEHFNKDAQEVK